MMKRMLVAAAIAAACAWPSTASAQDVTLTPFIGASFGGNLDTTRTAYGATLGFTAGGFGFDVDFGLTPNFFGKTNAISSSDALTLMANLKLAPSIERRGIKP